jgi:hypothetical protein
MAEDDVKARLGRVEVTQEHHGKRLDETQKQVEDIDTRTLQMDRKLDKLLSMQEARPQHGALHYLLIAGTTAAILGAVYGALDWWVSTRVDQKTAALTGQITVLGERVRKIDGVFEWQARVKTRWTTQVDASPATE